MKNFLFQTLIRLFGPVTKGQKAIVVNSKVLSEWGYTCVAICEEFGLLTLMWWRRNLFKYCRHTYGHSVLYTSPFHVAAHSGKYRSSNEERQKFINYMRDKYGK